MYKFRFWLQPMLIIVACLACFFVLANESIDTALAKCKSLEDDQPKQAIALAQDKMTQIVKSDRPILYGGYLGCAAWAAVGDNQSEMAQNYAIDLEMLAREIDDSEDKVNLLRRAGSVFHRLGNRVAAVDNYQVAMDLAEALGLKNAQIPILVNLGVLHSQIREHEQAIKDYQLALALMAQQDDFRYQAPVLFNLAVTLNGQQRYEESLPVFEQIEAMISPQWPDSRVAQVYTGLAAVHNGLGHYKKALGYNQKALNLFSKNDEKPLDYYISRTLYAEILIHLGEPEDALQIADEAWGYYQAPENRAQVVSINNPLYALAGVYEDVNKPLKALAVRKLATEIDGEFQDSFNKEAMAQMQARLSDSQQRKELAELKSQQAQNQIDLIDEQHNRQLILLVTAFAFILVILFLYWQRQTNKRLRAISLRDSLTKLGNRRAIKVWLAERKFPQSPKVRLMWLIDLDLFKTINDRYGHEGGDELLKELSKTLTMQTNEHRFIGRWGGEEFMFLTDDIVWQNIESFCDQLLTTIAQTKAHYKGESISITASVGVSLMKDSGKAAWQQALTTADKALYEAKDKGRNCMVCGE